MPVDWFRSPSWGDEDVAEFEKRLARSSLFNRPQYLRIKAMALDDAGLAAAADGLLSRVINEYPDSIFSAPSLERRGDIFRRGGDLIAAEECYRGVIARRPDLSVTSGTVPNSLAEVIFELHGRAAVVEVRSLLNYPQMRLAFIIQMMRALVQSARAAEATGNVELRRSEAQRALDLVTAPSQFTRHPDLGMPRLSEHDVIELQRLAGPDVTPARQSRRLFRRQRARPT